MATITADDPTHEAVQAAINAASDGDTVSIPAGAATWDAAVSIGSSSSRTKMVKLVGAGTDASTGTRITCAKTGPTPVLNVWLSRLLSPFEMSGIRFIQGVYDTDDEDTWCLIVNGHADTYASLIRIHDCYWQYPTADWNTGGWQNPIVIGGANSYSTPDNGHPYIWGVIDHCTFYSGGRTFQAIDVMPRYDKLSDGSNIYGVTTGNLGHQAWRDWLPSDHQGSWKNLFIEDCTFEAVNGLTRQAAIDGSCGAALVVRRNTCINNWMAGHGPDALGGARGTKWMEIYSNIFITRTSDYDQDGSDNSWIMAHVYKSGTGVCYNNTYWDATHKGTGDPYGIGSKTHSFHAQANRLEYARGSSAKGANPCQAVACGDETTSTCDNMDNASDPGKGWIGWDQPGAKRGEDDGTRTLGYKFVTDPIYFWNNKFSDTADDFEPYAADGTYIQADREYIQGTAKPGYAAYTYPHPLAAGVPPVGTPVLSVE